MRVKASIGLLVVIGTLSLLGAIITRLDLRITPPMTYHLLKQDRNVKFEISDNFFDESASKAEVFAYLSKEKHVLVNDRDALPDYKLRPNEYAFHRIQTQYGLRNKNTYVQAHFDNDNRLLSLIGYSSGSYW